MFRFCSYSEADSSVGEGADRWHGRSRVGNCHGFGSLRAHVQELNTYAGTAGEPGQRNIAVIVRMRIAKSLSQLRSEKYARSVCSFCGRTARM